MRRKKNERGFTLMELMVVIVIVAILAAVAVPLYINYVRDAQRTEARGAIGAIVTAEQVFFQQHRVYTNTIADLNVDLAEADANWDFAISGASDDGFVITANGATGRPTADLFLQYTHSRATPLAEPWSDVAPGGGGGGGGP